MLIALELVGALIAGGAAAHTFARKETPAYVLVATTACYAVVTFSFLLLLTDVLTTAFVLRNWWRFVYWTQFFFSFIVLPFLLKYE